MVGFTLVELLVAMTVTLSVLGAALAAAVPASTGFQTIPEHVDVQHRLREAAGALRGDLTRAMTGPSIGALAWHAGLWPPFRPCGWDRDPIGGAPGPCARPDAISLVLEDRAIQVETIETPSSPLDVIGIRRPAGCRPGASGCEFRAGDRAVIGDGEGDVDAFEIGWVSDDGSMITPTARLAIGVRAGAAIVSARVRTYYTTTDPASGLLQLRRLDGGSDLPVLDHLAEFSVDYIGEAAAPTVVTLPPGEASATYGPSPRRESRPGPDGGAEFVESCAFTIVNGMPQSRMAPLAAGPDGLAALPLSMLADGPWCPSPSTPNRFDLDLYRVRRVRVRLRTETDAEVFRGVQPAFFSRPGAGRDAARLVPGLGTLLDVAVRGAPW